MSVYSTVGIGLMQLVGRSVYALGNVLLRSSRPETHCPLAVGRQITPIQAINTGQTTRPRRSGEDICIDDTLLHHAYPGWNRLGTLHCYAITIWLQVLYPSPTLLGSLVYIQLY
jgi:hypothetical protein